VESFLNTCQHCTIKKRGSDLENNPNEPVSRPVPTDDDIERLYHQAQADTSGPVFSRKKIIFSVIVLLVGFAIFFSYQQGLWKHISSALEQGADQTSVENPAGASVNVIPITVQDNSMSPTITEGQTVNVASDYYAANPVERGDVVAVTLKTLPNPIIKRVAAVSGDVFTVQGSDLVLESSGTGSLVISPGSILFKQITAYGYTLPNGTIIVLGDNPAASLDSRSLGLLLTSQLSGKVIS
jgi:signal peptidase I